MSPPFRPFVPDEHCEVDGLLGAVPAAAQARGFLFDVVRRAFEQRAYKPPALPAIPFQFYPQRTYLEALKSAALVRCPVASIGFGLFEVGRSVYPTFATNLIGRAIFAIGRHDFARMTIMAPRAYAAASALARVTVREARPALVHVELTGAWDFVSYTCGIWRGAMDVCCIEPSAFEIRSRGFDHLEMKIAW